MLVLGLDWIGWNGLRLDRIGLDGAMWGWNQYHPGSPPQKKNITLVLSCVQPHSRMLPWLVFDMSPACWIYQFIVYIICNVVESISHDQFILFPCLLLSVMYYYWLAMCMTMNERLSVVLEYINWIFHCEAQEYIFVLVSLWVGNFNSTFSIPCG